MFSPYGDWVPEYFCCICSRPVPGTNPAVMCKTCGGYKPPPDFLGLLCVLHSTEGAFEGRAISNIACCNHYCYLVPWEESWCETPRLKWKQLLPCKIVYFCPQIMMSSLPFFSVGRRIFHSHFLFIHLIIMSTWNKIFKYGNKANIYFLSDFSLLLTDS